ncbi:MAG: hypothetical protein ACFFCI_20020 [Promethearchaeota archaeon]
MGSKKMKKMEKMMEKMSIMKEKFGMPSMPGMGGAFGLPSLTSFIQFFDPSFVSELSRHIAAKQVKRGISKGIEIARLKKDIELTNSIGPPEKLEMPLNKEELKIIAKRLYDLGYYYEKDPEKDDIEYTLAPIYMGLIGQASSKEQDSLQAAIKRFQRVHGISPEKCDGCIQPGDKTIKYLNSNLRISLVSHGMGPLFQFTDEKHDHLHPILKDFMDDLEWMYKTGSSLRQDIKRGRRKSKEESIVYSYYPKEIIVSYASRGYPGDGHKDLESKHYKARAIDVISVNGITISEAPRDKTIPSGVDSKLIQFGQMTPGFDTDILPLFQGPVNSFACALHMLKDKGDELPIKWRITELDSPWHGNTENHQDHIHVAIGRKTHIGSD